jgi:hypothetical protein
MPAASIAVIQQCNGQQLRSLAACIALSCGLLPPLIRNSWARGFFVFTCTRVLGLREDTVISIMPLLDLLDHADLDAPDVSGCTDAGFDDPADVLGRRFRAAAASARPFLELLRPALGRKRAADRDAKACAADAAGAADDDGAVAGNAPCSSGLDSPAAALASGQNFAMNACI